VILLNQVRGVSGLVLLLVLALSVPWLPISSASKTNVISEPVTHVVRGSAPLPPPQDPLLTSHEEFTLLLVSDYAAFERLSALHPDLTRTAVILVEPGDEAAFERLQIDLNGVRLARGLSPVLVDDLRGFN
jgi:hypothetical protein